MNMADYSHLDAHSLNIRCVDVMEQKIIFNSVHAGWKEKKKQRVIVGWELHPQSESPRYLREAVHKYHHRVEAETLRYIKTRRPSMLRSEEIYTRKKMSVCHIRHLLEENLWLIQYIYHSMQLRHFFTDTYILCLLLLLLLLSLLLIPIVAQEKWQ